jgi:tetratricopeptide (TPR) repeat protein
MEIAKTTLKGPNGTREPDALLRQQAEHALIHDIRDAEFKVLRLSPGRQGRIIKQYESYIDILKDAVSKEFLPNVQTPDAETLARAVRNADESKLFSFMAGTFQKVSCASFTNNMPFVSLAIESNRFDCHSLAVFYADALKQMGKEVSVFLNLEHVIIAGDACAFEPIKSYSRATFPLQEIDSVHPKMQEYGVGALLLVARTNIAVELFDRGRYEEAFKHFDEVLGIDPNFVYALYNKGIALKELNVPKVEAAVECFYKVLRIDPDDADMLSDIGEVFMKLGKKEEAHECFKMASEIRYGPKTTLKPTLAPKTGWCGPGSKGNG